MPVPSLDARRAVASRLVVVLCAFALLATAALESATPAEASSIGDRISSSRRGQSYAEAAMLAADAQIAAIKAQQKISRRALKQAKRAVKRNTAGKRDAIAMVERRKASLADVEARLAEAEALLAEAPEDAQAGLAKQVGTLRKKARGHARDVKQALKAKARVGQHLRLSSRQQKARQQRLRSLQRQRKAAVARRESAEGILGAYIVNMTDLARARLDQQVDVSLTAGASFSWPSAGRIAQTYGCTGFRLNPRRGSCRHFHDGLDIVSAYGSAVRATAVGVVAYVGWNPWDEGGRAWIVVIVHPNGYVSRYGHMIPSSRARAGQLVHTGKTIGRMGNTGRSTGTHLHFELLRGSSDVNPLSYLPTGVVKIKVDKSTVRKGKGKKATNRKKRAAQARKAKAQARRQKAREKASTQPDATQAGASIVPSEATSLDMAACEPGMSDAMTLASSAHLYAMGALFIADEPPSADPDCSLDEASDAARQGTGSSSGSPPGVPLPRRGTSPAPF